MLAAIFSKSAIDLDRDGLSAWRNGNIVLDKMGSDQERKKYVLNNGISQKWNKVFGKV